MTAAARSRPPRSMPRAAQCVENDRALTLCCTRDRGGRSLRFGTAVGGHVQTCGKRAAWRRHEGPEFGSTHNAGSDVIGLSPSVPNPQSGSRSDSLLSPRHKVRRTRGSPCRLRSTGSCPATTADSARSAAFPARRGLPADTIPNCGWIARRRCIPFSHKTTGIPRPASVSAANVPMMPPPMTTTPVARATPHRRLWNRRRGPVVHSSRTRYRKKKTSDVLPA